MEQNGASFLFQKQRLIDANALAEQVDNLCADWNENWIGNDNQSFILHSDVSDLICDAPTVDAVEVVHGRWIQSEPGYKLCSHCMADVAIYSGHRNYCPNCGAKMDGDGNG